MNVAPALAFAAIVLISAAPRAETPREFTNRLGMKFVWIPPGSFLMGSPKDEEARESNEIQHKVTLTRGFYLGVYAVTQEEWRAVMGANPSRFRGVPKLPVEQVSWEDCHDFLDKLGAKDGRAYRLPTEAEWEYACRAGTTSPFHFGATISTEQANFNGTTGKGAEGIYRLRTTPVGSFSPNGWGLYDMHGNVWQWCADGYGEYARGAVIDPHTQAQVMARVAEFVQQLGSPNFAVRRDATRALSDIGTSALPALRKLVGEAPDLETRRRAELLITTITDNGVFRVLRGGSFASPAASLRSAYRFKLAPSDRYDLAGFRVATSAK